MSFHDKKMLLAETNHANGVHEELILRRSGRIVHTMKSNNSITSQDVEADKAIRIMNRIERKNQFDSNMIGAKAILIGKNQIKIIH